MSDTSRKGAQAALFLGRTLAWLGTFVRIIAATISFVLLLYVVFTVFEANPRNGIVTFVSDLAHPLSWGFRDLFTPDDPKVRVAVNYLIAAVIYIIVGTALGRIIARGSTRI